MLPHNLLHFARHVEKARNPFDPQLQNLFRRLQIARFLTSQLIRESLQNVDARPKNGWVMYPLLKYRNQEDDKRKTRSLTIDKNQVLSISKVWQERNTGNRDLARGASQ